MPNRSLEAHHAFTLFPDDVMVELEPWFHEAELEDMNRMTIWHTHPNGGVGPSRNDMKHKARSAFHLVVTINRDRTFTPTWY